MSEEPATEPQIDSRKEFARQSGWMVIAMSAGGVLNFAVHVLANQVMPDDEWAVFTVLLRIMPFIAIPSAGLWTIFGRQGASALTAGQQDEFASTVRVVLAWLVAIWGIFAVGTWFARDAILTNLKLEGYGWALSLTVAAVLVTLVTPVFRGVLQGTIHFGGLGLSVLGEGLIRFVLGVLIVFFITKAVAGLMLATFLGGAASVGIAAWYSREVLQRAKAKVAWRHWMKIALPITFASGIMSLLMSFDTIFVRLTFTEDESKLYSPAWLVGFALTQFTVPIALVMFPRIVRSTALARKTDALQMTLIATAVIGGLAALASTLIPWLPAKILSPKHPEIAVLIPWIAWSMVAVTLANVLVGNLMGQCRFKVVPWVMFVGLGYVAVLFGMQSHLQGMDTFPAMIRMIQMLGLAGILIVVGAAWLTWGKGESAARSN